MSGEERVADFEVRQAVLRLLEDAATTMPWRAASSERYRTMPHEYVLRLPGHSYSIYAPLWDDFRAAIDRWGYDSRFGSRTYRYLDLGEYQYWYIDDVLNRAIKKAPLYLST